ncbi:hypothetical protein MY7_0420 [Bacillus sp. 5B6]|nr:hypothetical protein MY7_0420 [Bacillus sp. 5B6]
MSFFLPMSSNRHKDLTDVPCMIFSASFMMDMEETQKR